MHAAPYAIAWTFWRQHRWGLIALLAFEVIAVAVSAVLPAYVAPEAAPRFFGPLAIFAWLGGLGLFGVFCYAADAQDVVARASCFPSSQFTLPVHTAALAGAPIAFGAAAVAALWLITASLVLTPWLHVMDSSVPLWWPGMLAVAVLAWVQALLWSPFGLPGIRVALTVVGIVGVGLLVNFGLESGLAECALVSLFGVLAAGGWAVAYAGVAKARHGDIPDWQALLHPLRWLARATPRRARPFASARAAQTWFEWRRNGNSLPLMTALVVPFVLLFLALGKNDLIPPAQPILAALLVPVAFASIAGATTSGRHPWVKDYYGVSPFTATLPMSTASLVGAKLKAAARSTLTAWAVVAVMVATAVIATGHRDEVAEWCAQLWRADPLALLALLIGGVSLLIVWTWKHLVNSLVIGLTGRNWIIQAAIIAIMLGYTACCVAGGWIYEHPETHATAAEAAPWIFAVLLLCRVLLTTWILRQALRRDLLRRRTLSVWLAGWLLLASLLACSLAYAAPAGFAWHAALVALLGMPMTRLAATPLALAWNRHR